MGTPKGFVLADFMGSVFNSESPLFEYKGSITPPFDKDDKYHVFVTKEEDQPIEKRATQIYFDQDGNV